MSNISTSSCFACCPSGRNFETSRVSTLQELRIAMSLPLWSCRPLWSISRIGPLRLSTEIERFACCRWGLQGWRRIVRWLSQWPRRIGYNKSPFLCTSYGSRHRWPHARDLFYCQEASNWHLAHAWKPTSTIHSWHFPSSTGSRDRTPAPLPDMTWNRWQQWIETSPAPLYPKYRAWLASHVGG